MIWSCQVTEVDKVKLIKEARYNDLIKENDLIEIDNHYTQELKGLSPHYKMCVGLDHKKGNNEFHEIGCIEHFGIVLFVEQNGEISKVTTLEKLKEIFAPTVYTLVN